MNFRMLSCLLLASFFLSACTGPYSGKQAPRVKNGILDLRGWDFDRDGPVNLDGQWEFYWQKLLKPNDFQENQTDSRRMFMRLPGYWHDAIVDGTELPSHGFGTLRLKLYLDEPKEELAFQFGDITSAYRVYINDRLTDSVGVVDERTEKATPAHTAEIPRDLIMVPGFPSTFVQRYLNHL